MKLLPARSFPEPAGIFSVEETPEKIMQKIQKKIRNPLDFFRKMLYNIKCREDR